MNATEQAFRATANQAPSQEAKILAYLTENQGKWIAMPELCDISNSYCVHSRISGLRTKGHVILQQNRRLPGNRTIYSYYKIES